MFDMFEPVEKFDRFSSNFYYRVSINFYFSLRFLTTNQNPNKIYNENNNLNLRNYSIFLSFFLDTSTSSVQVKKQKSQGSEFLFCSQSIILQLFTTRREQF